MSSSPEEVILADLPAIIRHFYPGAVIGYRTAIEAKPSSAGFYHLTYGRKDKTHVLPGVTLRIWKGSPAQAGDTQLGADLFMASRPRALLENPTESRARAGSERKTLDRVAVEGWLDRLCRIHGPDELRRLLASMEERTENIKTRAIEFNADDLNVGRVEAFAHHLTGKQKSNGHRR